MDNSARLQFLFNKYQDRACTPHELKELVELLQQADAAETLNGPMEELWQQLKNERPANNVDWDSMYALVSSQPDELKPYHYKSPFRRYWYYAAAAILIAAVSIAAIYQYGNKTIEKNNQAAVVHTDSLRHANTRQTIHLPDGSRVVLNSNSKLDYPVAFNGNTREVYITGEAFFDIAHNPTRPFIVHAGSITTKVLGTTFNIRAYPADDNVQVTVVKGKVQVSESNQTLGTLTASQQLSFSKTTKAVIQKETDAGEVIAWKPKEMLFNNITMKEAAEQLEQRFNLQVKFENEAIKNCRVTATFSEDDLPEEILLVICGVSNATYTINNSKVSIDGKGCN